jgi:hypothetical protein
MEKSLGITKYKQGLSSVKRMKKSSESIKAARQKEAEMQDVRRRQEQTHQDDQTVSKISSLATTIMLRDGVSLAVAMTKAKEEYQTND